METKSRSKWSPARLKFLVQQKPGFAKAFKDSDTKNWFANTFRRFLKRFPPSLADDVDPPQEVLDAVDDKAPDTYRLEVPNESTMEEEEYKEAMLKYQQENDQIVKLRERLNRWFYNQHAKDRASTKANPFKSMLDDIITGNTSKPRYVPPLQTWRKDPVIKAEIEGETQEIIQRDKILLKDVLTTREDVVRRLFEEKVSAEERKVMEAEAKKVHDRAVAEWALKRRDGFISKSPEDRQRCIDALVSIVQPLLDAICDATGWSASLIAGGPEPADEGRIHMTMLHSGTTTGVEPMDFGRAEHARLPALLYPMYSDFLHLVYPPEVCKSRALPSDTQWTKAGDGQPTVAIPERPTIGLPSQSPSSPPPVSPPPASPLPTLPSENPALDFDDDVDMQPLESRPVSPNPSLPASPPPRSPSQHPDLDDADDVDMQPPESPLANTPLDPVEGTVFENGGSSSQHVPVGKRRASAMEGVEGHSRADGQAEGEKNKRQQLTETPTTVSSKRPRGRKTAGSASTSLSTITTTDTTTTTTTTAPTPITSATESSNPAIRFTPTNGDSSWLAASLTLFLTGQTLGDEWSACVDAYRAFQDRHGYDLERRLPTKGRPALVGKWIGVGRTCTPKWRPAGLDPKTMKKEFGKWWAGLQPKWRVKDDAVVESLVDGEWRELLYPGVNGLLSVVACLFFWGIACEKAVDKRAWSAAVHDCTVAFKALNALDHVAS